MHLMDSEDDNRFFRKKIDGDVVRAYKEALRFVSDRARNYCESRDAGYILLPAYTPVADIFFGTLSDMEVLK